MKKVYDVYNADNEDPKCERCDHLTGPEKYCNKNCGPEHWWNGYERTVYEEEDFPVHVRLNRREDNEEDIYSNRFMTEYADRFECM